MDIRRVLFVLLVCWCIVTPAIVESDSEKKPSPKSTAGDNAPAAPQKAVAPAVVVSDVSQAIKQAKEKAAADVDAAVIKAVSYQAPPPPPAPAGENPAPPAEMPPVVLSLPDVVRAPVGIPVKVKATTNGVMVRWLAKDDGLAMIDGELLKDSTLTQVWANYPGQYRLLAYTSLNDVLSDPVQCLVVVHGAQPPPQPTPVPPQPEPIPPEPEPTPPPTLAAHLWVVTVDNVAKRDAATTRVLTDMQLDASIRAAGHQFKKINSTIPEAQKFMPMMQANGGIPVVVIMDADKVEHNWLNQAPADLKLPTTSQGLKDLINKYTTSKVR